MTALTATAGPDGTVTLTATGLPVFGSVFDPVPPGTDADFGAGNADTTVSSVNSGDPDVGMANDAQWFKGTTTFGRAQRSRASGVAVGENFVVDMWIANVQGQPAAEVWLVTDDGFYASEHIIHERNDGLLPVWKRHRLYFQADSTDFQVRIIFQPLYPYHTSAWIMWQGWTVYENDAPTHPYHDTVTVTRTDANGTDVAVPVAQNDANTTGTLTLTDHEAALTGPVTYTLTDTAFGDASAVVTLDDPGTYLSSNAEAVSHPVDLVIGYTGDRQTTGTMHRPVRRTYPVVVQGPLTAREGTLDLFCQTRTAALDLLELLKTGAEAVLRQPTVEDLDVRFVPRRVTERPAEVGTDLWMVTADYVEVQ